MESLDRLHLFTAIIDAGSFTKAAAQLGIAQSTLSYSLKQLETSLGVRLVQRNTRSLALTEAGQRLYDELKPLLRAVQNSTELVQEFAHEPQSRIRLTGSPLVFRYLLQKPLAAFRRAYPNVCLELHSDVRFTDIIHERFDAGIRLGGFLAKDMIARRISPDLTMTVAASPSYLERHGAPQTVDELHSHSCLLYRLPSLDNLMAWEFCDKNGRTFSITPSHSPLITNDFDLLFAAAKAGEGLIWLPEFVLKQESKQGELVAVLKDDAVCYEGFHLYYPSRRESPVFNALVQMLVAAECGLMRF
ncbi:LysR family transcriptional regulator [Avibacterium sp. 21-595]|uniref:LysR family transcriptional regulator n=1 Tax=Avibacterium sp. 21-595 TaxID=2911527 RepID=UPI0020260BFC|nr:LysR family transcriptional regulator [Avibacterium sp. 21-595]URL07534.1 LysR family transcriptional regulator [Avibacterium sp. 21-595]